jgi:hypothetical protein
MNRAILREPVRDPRLDWISEHATRPRALASAPLGPLQPTRTIVRSTDDYFIAIPFLLRAAIPTVSGCSAIVRVRIRVVENLGRRDVGVHSLGPDRITQRLLQVLNR